MLSLSVSGRCPGASIVASWSWGRRAARPGEIRNNPASADNLPLKVKPGCDAFVVRFGPVSWRVDRGELVLGSARGQTWRDPQQPRQRRQLAAESEAGLRCFRCPFRAGVLARRSWRVGLGVGARPDLARSATTPPAPTTRG